MAYSEEHRESLVRRMLSAEIGMSALARETGIAEATLYRWRDQAHGSGESVSKSRKQDRLSSAQKLAVLAQAAGMNQAELGEYCRQQGLYPEQVKGWRAQAEQSMAGGTVSVQAHRAALGAEKKRREAVERELKRKEKALAETAALLTLRKKAAAIWGEGEDE